MLKGHWRANALETLPDLSQLMSIGYPTNGDPTRGVPPTQPGAEWFFLMDQMRLSVIEGAGETQDDPTDTQLFYKSLLKCVIKGVGAGSITSAMLADRSVVTVKLADGSVTTPKLGVGSVSFDKVAASAVATDSEAKAGTATDKIMTPKATAAAIADLKAEIATLKTELAKKLSTEELERMLSELIVEFGGTVPA